jgi:hypothetical protein
MKTMFVLISHTMTEEQRLDAQISLGVKKFVVLETKEWCQVPAESDSVLPHLATLQKRVREESSPGDILLVQGDFGATYAMVEFAHTLQMTPVYATTQREAVEKREGERVITTRVFRHVRFRKYERMR